jgi:hypothetical protein
MTPTQDERSIKPYKTSDTPFAAYLHYLGYKLVTSVQDPNDYKREVLVFVFDDKVPELEKEWRLGESKGDLKKYHRSLKIVNRTINDARKTRS